MGILPVILNGQAGSLSYHSVYPPIMSFTGTKLSRIAIVVHHETRFINLAEEIVL